MNLNIIGLFLIFLALLISYFYSSNENTKKKNGDELYPDEPEIYEAYYNKNYKYDIPDYILENDYKIIYYQ